MKKWFRKFTKSLQCWPRNFGHHSNEYLSIWIKHCAPISWLFWKGSYTNPRIFTTPWSVFRKDFGKLKTFLFTQTLFHAIQVTFEDHRRESQAEEKYPCSYAHIMCAFKKHIYFASILIINVRTAGSLLYNYCVDNHLDVYYSLTKQTNHKAFLSHIEYLNNLNLSCA